MHGVGHFGSERMVRDGRQLLARAPLFAAFAAADLDALLACSHERAMQTGETLFQRGDPGLSMMAILAGEVRIVLSGEQGKDQVLSTLTAGAVFGEIALFDGRPRTADAVAATKGRLLVIERAAAVRLMEQDPAFARRVLELVCLRLRATLAQLDSVLFHDVPHRLCTFLLEQRRESGRDRIDVTQSRLGQIVGAARETVNRNLRALEAERIVALSQGRITILDPDRLSSRLAHPPLLL